MRFVMLVQELTSDIGSGNLLMFQSTPELARSAREWVYLFMLPSLPKLPRPPDSGMFTWYERSMRQ